MDPTYRKIEQLLTTTQMLAEELEIVYDILDNLFEEEDYDLSVEALLEKKNWIQKAIKKEGSLRKTLKAKKGKNIPASKLKKAAEKGGKTGKRARLAMTLRKLNETVDRNGDGDIDASDFAQQQFEWTQIGGWDVPSREFGEGWMAATELGRQASAAKYGSPQQVELSRAALSARKQMEAHPHFGEFRKGHPRKRNQPKGPEMGPYIPASPGERALGLFGAD
jgi:hypothetical protein